MNETRRCHVSRTRGREYPSMLGVGAKVSPTAQKAFRGGLTCGPLPREREFRDRLESPGILEMREADLGKQGTLGVVGPPPPYFVRGPEMRSPEATPGGAAPMAG